MLYDESDSNESLVGSPKKKIRLINEDSAQSFEKENSFHSLSLFENNDNSNSKCSKNDDTNTINQNFDFKSQHLNYNDSVSTEELESDCNINKYDDSDSDDYIPISDSEFELAKVINDETNSMKSDDESIENNKYYDDTNSNELTTTNSETCADTNEVHNLLDQAYQDKHKTDSNKKKKKHGSIKHKDITEECTKTVLEEVCKNNFDVLPEDWIQATHKSGMPIYLHKKSRVVTLSRPYFLGPGDPKLHLAPLSAITCLQYQKGLESKELIKNKPNKQVNKLGDIIIPNTKIETAQENIIKESLTHEELRTYCQSLFKFKKVAREIPQVQNVESENSSGISINTKERPSLPENTKLITFSVETEKRDEHDRRRWEWIMNPNCKSSVSILHEYLQQALKTQPSYEFELLDNKETPHSATVILNDVRYGVGLGVSKKKAKINAAQATLDILIPEITNKIYSDNDKQDHQGSAIFDQIKITDHRVIEYSSKTTDPCPYTILTVCLKRNFGECDINTEFTLFKNRRKLNKCTMTVGKHIVTVNCKNKKDGKQKASQAILALLHPHIDNWGTLLRLYNNRSIKNKKEKKQEQQDIFKLQGTATPNQPNFAILNKLNEVMIESNNQRKLEQTDQKLGLHKVLLSAKCPYVQAKPSVSNSDDE